MAGEGGYRGLVGAKARQESSRGPKGVSLGRGCRAGGVLAGVRTGRDCEALPTLRLPPLRLTRPPLPERVRPMRFRSSELCLSVSIVCPLHLPPVAMVLSTLPKEGTMAIMVQVWPPASVPPTPSCTSSTST